jgi:hypothetical protein
MSSVTVVPDTLHTELVCELKLTVRPEDALALTVNDPVLGAWFDNGPKVIVWEVNELPPLLVRPNTAE